MPRHGETPSIYEQTIEARMSGPLPFLSRGPSGELPHPEPPPGGLDGVLDRQVRLAARLLDAPMAVLALVGPEQSWQVVSFGLDAPRSGDPFRQRALGATEVRVVRDVRADQRFSGNPLVTGSAGVRFFAGTGLQSTDGQPLGVLYVLDTRVRTLTHAACELFAELATMVAARLERSRSQAFAPAEERLPLFVDEEDQAAIRASFAQRKKGDSAASARARYERLVHQIDGIVWEGTVNCRTNAFAFSFVSERLWSVLGYDPQRWLADATRWVSAIQEEDRPWVPAARMESSRVGHHHAAEYRMTTADGRIVWIRDVVRVVEAQGEVVTVAGLMLDVTERKGAEAALRAAKEEAEAMARRKSAFLTSMSHEIRTPLTAIIGFTEVLRDETTGPHREYIELIAQGGDRLMETLNSVLDLARLESGTLNLKPVQMDLVAVARDTVRFFQKQAGAKGLSLRVHAPVPAPLRVDHGAIVRVLSNLVSNAIKFTDSGGITVTIERRGDEVLLSVEDTGVGVSPVFMPRLFDDFMQESEGLSRHFEGTGLGLPITKRLVDLMGGRIEVESEKGKGTTFRVSLPPGVPLASRPAKSNSTRSRVRRKVKGPTGELSRILLVEDNEAMRLLVAHLLSSDYRVDVAPDAAEALAKAGGQRYDLVLLDISLGTDRDGVQVLQAMRGLLGYDQVPVIAVTANALPEHETLYRNEGFDAYLRKPFTRRELHSKIETTLRPRSSQGLP